MKKGLFIGRFQPFHLGHLSAVSYALKYVDVLVIAIGSSQHGHTPKNPFTARERERIIRASLKEAGIKKSRYKICRVPDIGNDAKWPGHTLACTGRVDVVFTRSPIVRRLFKKYSTVPTITVPKKLPVSATLLRKSMRQKGPWQKDISPSAAHIIASLGDAPQRRTKNPKSPGRRTQKS